MCVSTPACGSRTFGYNCSSTCHCLNNTSCNSTTGECDIGLCESGWKGQACDQGLQFCAVFNFIYTDEEIVFLI